MVFSMFSAAEGRHRLSPLEGQLASAYTFEGKFLSLAFFTESAKKEKEAGKNVNAEKQRCYLLLGFAAPRVATCLAL